MIIVSGSHLIAFCVKFCRYSIYGIFDKREREREERMGIASKKWKLELKIASKKKWFIFMCLKILMIVRKCCNLDVE